MPLAVKFIEPDKIDEVIEFHNNARSDTDSVNNRKRVEFEWLFFKGPIRPALYACAINTVSGEIVGTQGGIFIPMVSRTGEKLITIKGEDTLISLDRASEIKGQDILKELIKSISQKSRDYNADLIWGFTPARSAFKRCGFNIVGEIRNSFYVIKPYRFFRNRVKELRNNTWGLKIKLFVFSVFNWLINQLRLYRSSDFYARKISIDEINERQIGSFTSKGLFNLQLNRDFLRWRIIDNPCPVKYEFFEATNKKGEVVSYLIMSHDKENIWYVEHFVFSESLTESVKIAIIIKTYRMAKSGGAIFIKAPGFDHNMANREDMRLLSRAGSYFFSNQPKSYFVFKSLSDKKINPEEIYLSRLNTQGIR